MDNAPEFQTVGRIPIIGLARTGQEKYSVRRRKARSSVRGLGADPKRSMLNSFRAA